MRPTLRVLMPVLVTLAIAAPLSAQWRNTAPPPAPCLPCVPGQPGQPGQMGQPGQPGNPADPNNPNPQNANQPNANQNNGDNGDSGGRGSALASGSASLPGFVGGFGQRPGVVVVGGGGTTNALFSGFKILEGDSLVPIDRIYTSFSYTNGIVQNFTSQGGSLSRFDEFRELFGVEKTFWNDRASVTFRVPVSTIHAIDNSSFTTLPGNGGPGTSTIVDDASIILKAILYDNPERGNMFTGGFEFSFPISNNYYFQGNNGIQTDTRDWILEPYVGSIFRRGEFTFQDSTGFGFPTSAAHAIYFYTSNSAAWTFYQSPNPKQFVTSMSGVAELFVLEPLGGFRAPLTDTLGTADLISVTIGNSIVFRNRYYLSYGISSPITKTKPYNTELVTSLSIRY